ncbi:restriction endonuclease subunit S [Streptococcus thermophilus]|uniref:restriction endonuclease subunit S n=1 Tax=Streptococcus thermophilus TaxID=1308 RepID=UPI003A7F85F6
MKNHKEQFPKIRFKDNIIHTYCDEWRQHKLGEVFEQTVEYVDPYEQNLELWSVTVESGLTPKEERYNREFLVKKSDKFKKLYPEEIVYNPMNITIGAVGFNNVGKEVAVSGYYVTMKIKSKFSNKFFSVWLSCPKAISLYKIYSTGSLIERQRVQFPTLSEIRASFPSFTEQSAIGSLFRTLDDLLVSYKDNLANYQSLKATMLSKMFPKVGQTVPEIRLDGFEGEWENKILSEVTNITMGQSPKSENYTDNPNDYILVQGNADIKDKQVVPRLWTTEVTKMAEIGDIILTVRAPVGDIGKTDYNVVIGRGVAAIKGNDFIFYTLEKMKMTGFWNKFSTGSTFESISSNDIKEAIIQIPTLEEQQAIGAYFSNLDNLINSYQEKISQLETLKKKLLQDMFI